MAKEVTGQIKLQIKAGQANPAPPVGPALGQHGVNIAEFCKQFNDKTKEMTPGMPIPVIINVYKDRSFDFTTKMPPVSFLIQQKLKLKKGSSEPGKDIVGRIKWNQIREIAEEKMQDLNANDVEAAARQIAGTARSMGLDVIEEAA